MECLKFSSWWRVVLDQDVPFSHFYCQISDHSAFLHHHYHCILSWSYWLWHLKLFYWSLLQNLYSLQFNVLFSEYDKNTWNLYTNCRNNTLYRLAYLRQVLSAWREIPIVLLSLQGKLVVDHDNGRSVNCQVWKTIWYMQEWKKWK